MEYFNLQHINDYNLSVGKLYESQDKGTLWYLDTREKLKYLITLLNDKLSITLIQNYSEKPNKQAGQGNGFVLKDYVLIGCVPEKHKNVEDKIFIKIKFVKWGNEIFFVSEVDINNKLNNNQYKSDRAKLQSATTKTYPVDETFPKDWESLVALILPQVKNEIEYLDNYLGGNQEKDNGEKPNTNKFPLNQILFGPPGTGKTFNSINKAISIANPGFDLTQDRKTIKKEFDRLLEIGQIVFTTFHQSMSYEDFIEGIKPETDEKGSINYQVKDGIFKFSCNAAKTPNQSDFDASYEKLKTELTENELINLKTPKGNEFAISLNSNDNLSLHTGKHKEKQGTLTKANIQKQINGEDKFKGWEGYFSGVINYLKSKYGYSTSPNKNVKNYVLIIDEINRGNVSQIFGELITLVEEDKREGKEEALKIVLPYSKEKFSVPSNLYIIGTMNTADRSVEALDTALRRRFIFEEMPPIPELIATKGKLKETAGVLEDINLVEVLQVINKRIEQLLDKDHQIGHSYLMSVSTIEELKVTFQNKIIPLLQEYFFGDYGKIGLVLGEAFFEKTEQNSTCFKPFFNYPTEDFDSRTIYKLKDFKTNNEEFINAIKSII